MVNNTVYKFVGSNLGVEIFFKKREHKKGASRQKIEASLYTLYWGFKKILFTLYTYVLTKILQNGAKFVQKLTPGFEASLYTLYWSLKKIQFTLYTYVLTKILQNGAKFIQKLTPGFKNHMRNLDNFRQAVESPKS